MGRKISDLKVADLRSELELRGLDSKGVKSLLVERLLQALEKEGLDPQTFLEMRSAGGDGGGGSGRDSQGQQDSGSGSGEHAESKGDSEVSLNESSEMGVVESHAFEENNSTQSTEPEIEQHTTEQNEVTNDNLEADSAVEESSSAAAVNKEKSQVQANERVQTHNDDDTLNITVDEGEEKFDMDEEVCHQKSIQEESEDTAVTINKCETDRESQNSTRTLPVAYTQAASDSQTSELSVVAEGTITDEKNNEKSEEGDKSIGRKLDKEDRHTLLVTGLPSQVAATEVKALFKKHGKIGGVKIMSNAKDPEGSRFALVAVMSAEDANICIKSLDGFELHGRIIHVDRAGAEMLSAEWLRKDQARGRKDRKISNETSEVQPSSKESMEPEEKDSSSTGDIRPKSERKSSTEQKQKLKEESERTKPKSHCSTAKTVTSSDDAKKDESSKKSEGQKKDDGKKAVASQSSSKLGSANSGSKVPQRRSSAERREARKNANAVTPFVRKFPYRGSSPSHRRGGFRGGPPRYQAGREDYHRRVAALKERERARERELHHRVRRSRSPVERYRRESPRRRELTFEDIYDARQREKDRVAERHRREAERVREEEMEKQRMLDMEFKRLAREREKIEREKTELKRQKEKMIVEEREKQRIEKLAIEREKELLAQRGRQQKRVLEEDYRKPESAKRLALDHHRYSEKSVSRPEKGRLRTHRDEQGISPARIAPGPLRSAPGQLRSAPIRVSPVYDRNNQRGGDRHSQRGERAHDTARYSHETASASYNSSVRTPSSKPMDTFYSGSGTRDNRWPAASSTSFSAATSSISSSRNPDWEEHETSWEPSSDRLSIRPIASLQERWSTGAVPMGGGSGGVGGRINLPLGQTGTSMFSSATDNLSMGTSFGSSAGLYSSPYDYKLPSSNTSHRR